jgi:hypothetical protein
LGVLVAEPVGEKKFTRLREALWRHRSRLDKSVLYLFD